VEAVRSQLEEKGLSLTLLVPEGVRLHTDRKRLLQCVLNYVGNAVKYTEAGSVRIECRELGDDVEVSVSDTGIGVPPEALGKLFLPFERVDTHLRVKTPGTGLGLYLTRKLATELLGGEVSVESEAGKGSTFRLRVPRDVVLPRTPAGGQS
jgi:signal transduction histidine kinase